MAHITTAAEKYRLGEPVRVKGREATIVGLFFNPASLKFDRSQFNIMWGHYADGEWLKPDCMVNAEEIERLG